MKARSEKPVEPQGTLFVTPLEDVLPSSMLPYAEFVIMDRALPRVEDGLKPVQRRILYTMHEMGLMPDKPHKKSARIVGDCMGKYHPHGDSSVYDAMVRMAQNFNMGRTLVNGHGNFGSVDGDPAAAMRYTEARLEPLALELLRDLDKNTVPFSLNFDDSLKEPDMLPGRFPNLLVNGASGIAVGLATNIPPHNLAEVIDGVVAYIDRPTIKLPDLMKYIPAPDFPTGGVIIRGELDEAYASGKGRISIRAKMSVEEAEGGKKKNFIITELPYQVNKANLLRKIAELKEEKPEFESIVRVTDESDRTGMRAVIEVKADADIAAIEKALWKYTDLEVTFGINMVAIAGGKPMLMGLLDIVKYYVAYQRDVVLRRTRFDLNQAKERCHILEGLIIAVRNIDDVIKIIKSADSTADAREKLRNRFDLSEKQAQAILDLRLARLTKLEVFKLEEELKALKELIEKLTAIVNSNRLQLQVVKEELIEIRKRYKTPRKSEIKNGEEEAGAERTDIRAPGVPCLACITADNRIKTVTERNFNQSNKDIAADSCLHQVIVDYVNVLTDEVVFIFSDVGNCYYMYAGDFIKKFSERGYQLKDLFEEAGKGEVPVSIVKAGVEEGDLLFFTEQGMIKRTARKEYVTGKQGYPAIRLNDGDRLIRVQPDTEDEEDTIFFVTRGGMCLNARKDDIPQQGRIAGGVKGMKLKEGDSVKFVSQIDAEGEIVVAISGGRYKRVIASQVDSLPRYRMGVQIASLKGEEVLFADYVTVPYMLAVVTEDDTMTSISTEMVPIDATYTRGRPLKYVKWTAKRMFAMKYLLAED